MPIALVQEKGAAHGATTSHSVTFDASPIEGNLLVLAFQVPTVDANITGPSGWTRAIFQERGTAFHNAIWYKVAAAGESATVTWTTTVSVGDSMQIWEWSGLTATPLDKTGQADGGAGTVTSLAVGSTGTLSQANELAITVCGQNSSNGGTEAIDSSFTIRNAVTFTNMTTGDLITSATTALNPTHSWATARTAAGCSATFKGRPSDSPNVFRRRQQRQLWR